jgi:trans-2,3-dihydro-3-hydroxyanthranilate isomerase
MESLKGKTFPIVSVVKGMSFSLVDLTDAPEVMAALRAGKSPAAKLDEEWNVGLVGCLYFARQGVEQVEGQPTIHKIHQRMMVQGLEDPGTGSASCALSCYLALTMTDNRNGQETRQAEKNGAPQKDVEIAEGTKTLNAGAKKEHYVFGIEQGVEMGRKCQICVEVDITVNEEGKRVVSAVMLSGRSTFVTKGEIINLY